MNEENKALSDLLKFLADHPELADRIVITVKPYKVTKGKPPEKPKNK